MNKKHLVYALIIMGLIIFSGSVFKVLAQEFPLIVTTHYKIAESERALQTSPWLPYPINPFFTNYVLGNQEPGKKVIFVQFKDNENTLSEVLSQEIDVVGPPPVISNINCSRSLTGTGLSIKISGTQFGAQKGAVELRDDKGSTSPLAISSWVDDEINGTVVVGAGDAEGNSINFTVSRPDQINTSGVCTVGGLSDIALGAKLFCRTLSDTDTDQVEVVIAENKTGGKVTKLKDLVIDKDGILQGVDRQFENGQEYIVSIKAPGSIRRVSKPFTAGDGTVQLVFRENGLDDGNQNVLPIGDIAPLGNPDGKIDNRDKFELIREFGLTADGDANIRAADFNQDKAVNSIDWACMRYDFPSPGETVVDDPEPKAGDF